MDVEQVQKINNLALDLMRQGLASDREDAIAQAEKIYSGEMNEHYTSIKTASVQSHHEPSSSKQDSELSQDSIRSILEQNSKFLVKQIKEFQEKIAVLEGTVSDLRKRVDSQRIPSVSDLIGEYKQVKQQPAQQQQSHQIQAQQVHVQAAAPVEKKQEPHPRVGNFNGADVSIEKFFYMGSK